MADDMDDARRKALEEFIKNNPPPLIFLPSRYKAGGLLILDTNHDGIVLGADTQTGQEIRIDDTARRSGVYVLGKSGFGKSVLLSSMAIQDATNGHGLFFLDPHGDAIRGIAPKLPKPP